MEAELSDFILYALDDMGAFLAANNYPPMTEAQRLEFSQRLVPRVMEIFNHNTRLTEDEVGLLACAAALDALHEVVFDGAPTTADGQLGLGLELAVLAATHANTRICEGGYPRFTDAQRDALITAARKQATALVASGRSPTECRASMTAFVDVALAVLLGPAPARAHLN